MAAPESLAFEPAAAYSMQRSPSHLRGAYMPLAQERQPPLLAFLQAYLNACAAISETSKGRQASVTDGTAWHLG